jgi:hypothetical protein
MAQLNQSGWSNGKSVAGSASSWTVIVRSLGASAASGFGAELNCAAGGAAGHGDAGKLTPASGVESRA